MSIPISRCQPLFPTIAREVPEDDVSIIDGQNGQTSSLAIGRKLQWLSLNPTQHGEVKVLRWDCSDRPGPRLWTYYSWTLSTVDGFRPDRYVQTARHISHTYENNTRVFNEQQQAATQDQWDLYNVYPQVMSILGEEAVERHETLSSRCCQEYVDEQEDTDDRSANDSGIDLDLIQPSGDEEHCVALDNYSQRGIHDNALCGRSEGAPLMRYRWSVDETIALHLLEAMESRTRDAQGNVNRIEKKKRKGHRLRQRMVKLFREIRTRYLS